MKMARKNSNREVTLHSERLGSEEKVQAVLADWGMDEVAIRRILDEHRTRQRLVRAHPPGKTNAAYGIRVNHTLVIPSSSPAR
jgi:hypothetical protein